MDSLADDEIDDVTYVHSYYEDKYTKSEEQRDSLIIEAFKKANHADQKAILCILEKYLDDDQDFSTCGVPSPSLSKLIVEKHNTGKLQKEIKKNNLVESDQVKNEQ